MTTVARRTSSPVAEMLDWLESYSPFKMHGEEFASLIRVEDFIEDDAYVLRAELPGIDPEKDVEVSIDNDMLTISGERREETKEKNRREFHYGSFSRMLHLPKGAKADEITASYNDGILEVRVPLATEEAQSVRIPIQRATKE